MISGGDNHEPVGTATAATASSAAAATTGSSAASADDGWLAGAGNDIFVYSTRKPSMTTRSPTSTAGDRVDLSFLHVADLASLRPFMTQDGADVVITLGYAQQLRGQPPLQGRFPGQPHGCQLRLQQLGLGPHPSPAPASATRCSAERQRQHLRRRRQRRSLVGGAGTDRLVGGSGDDWLMGGAGNDVFAYNTRGFNSDTIADFNVNGDKVDLAFLNVADLDSLRPFMEQVGDDVVITLGYDMHLEVIRLQNVSLADPQRQRLRVQRGGDEPLPVTGTGFRDTLFGGNGNDTISAGAGNDSLVGGAGTDRLVGGSGDDWLMGRCRERHLRLQHPRLQQRHHRRLQRQRRQDRPSLPEYQRFRAACSPS